MHERRLRMLLVSTGATLALCGVLAVSLLLPGQRAPLASPTAGCEKYPVVQAMWVCRGSVYLLRGRKMQWAGPLSSLAPMPKPPATKR